MSTGLRRTSAPPPSSSPSSSSSTSTLRAAVVACPINRGYCPFAALEAALLGGAEWPWQEVTSTVRPARLRQCRPCARDDYDGALPLPSVQDAKTRTYMNDSGFSVWKCSRAAGVPQGRVRSPRWGAYFLQVSAGFVGTGEQCFDLLPRAGKDLF